MSVILYELHVYGVQHLMVTVFDEGGRGTVVLKLTVYKAVNNELLWTLLLYAMNCNTVSTSTFSVSELTRHL